MISLNPTIEFAKKSDANEISALSRDEIEHGLRRRYTPERIRELMESTSKNIVVARDKKTLLGFGIMTYRNNDANLDLLAVKDRYRGNGIARDIVEWLIAVAMEAGAHSVYVQVRKSNEGAVKFYRRLSFQKIDELVGYYQGKETGVIFCKTLRPIFTAT
jgi:ribosomal-protein-alanine N-acetyltransferase